MENITTVLGTRLLAQAFQPARRSEVQLQEARRLARQYAAAEQAVVVLSDLVSNKSYVYCGAAAAALGLSGQAEGYEIDSIWEEEIFARIHPDDLQAKHIQELRFFQHLKTVPAADRSAYHVVRRLRMRHASGDFVPVLHRMYYLFDPAQAHAEFALCLYGFDPFPTTAFEGRIVDARTGRDVAEGASRTTLLSAREQEILTQIHRGKPSKEIAALLSISLHTVNRHRQNILEKLRVRNSVDACRIAVSFNWIS